MAYIAEIAGTEKYESFMQIFWIVIQASQVLGNFLGGFWMKFQDSLSDYLTGMIILSSLGILLFLALPSDTNLEITPPVSAANPGEINATPVRADTFHSNVTFGAKNISFPDRSEHLMDETDLRTASSKRLVLPYCQEVKKRLGELLSDVYRPFLIFSIHALSFLHAVFCLIFIIWDSSLY